jgi:hypothetical protein
VGVVAAAVAAGNGVAVGKVAPENRAGVVAGVQGAAVVAGVATRDRPGAARVWRGYRT